jgi:hypothetical protein
MSFLFLTFFFPKITYIKVRTFKAIFQLLPLSDAYKYNVPEKAIDTSMSAIDIFQSLYQNAKLRVQECEFLISPFFLKGLPPLQILSCASITLLTNSYS